VLAVRFLDTRASQRDVEPRSRPQDQEQQPCRLPLFFQVDAVDARLQRLVGIREHGLDHCPRREALSAFESVKKRDGFGVLAAGGEEAGLDAEQRRVSVRWQRLEHVRIVLALVVSEPPAHLALCPGRPVFGLRLRLGGTFERAGRTFVVASDEAEPAGQVPVFRFLHRRRRLKTL
jgi:hypothetical protein